MCKVLKPASTGCWTQAARGYKGAVVPGPRAYNAMSSTRAANKEEFEDFAPLDAFTAVREKEPEERATGCMGGAVLIRTHAHAGPATGMTGGATATQTGQWQLGRGLIHN